MSFDDYLVTTWEPENNSQRKKEPGNPGPNQKIWQSYALELWRMANIFVISFEWKGSKTWRFRTSWLYWWQPSAINYPKVINSIQSTLPIKPMYEFVVVSKQMTWTNVFHEFSEKQAYWSQFSVRRIERFCDFLNFKIFSVTKHKKVLII